MSRLRIRAEKAQCRCPDCGLPMSRKEANAMSELLASVTADPQNQERMRSLRVGEILTLPVANGVSIGVKRYPGAGNDVPLGLRVNCNHRSAVGGSG